MYFNVTIKKTTNLFLALLLGGSFLQSCSDEDENVTYTNSSSETGCYLTQETIETDGEIETIIYIYENNKITSATSIFEQDTLNTITFEYDGDRVIRASDDFNDYQLLYSGDNSIPSRVDVKSGTEITGYYVIQSSGQNITEFEDHDLSTGDDIINSMSTFSYNNSGNLTQCIFNELNQETNELEEFLTFDVSTYDNRKNPYNSNFVFFIMDPENPLLVGNQNIVSGTISIDVDTETVELPFASSYEYNDDQYPTSSSFTIPGLTSENRTLIYNCK